MKSKLLIPVAVAAALFATHGAFAQNGPNVQTLVQISDEFDLNNKKHVTQSNVLDRIGKQHYYRTIYEVTERPKAPTALKKAFVVEETTPVATTVLKTNLYRVERTTVQDTVPRDTWVYEQR